MTVEPEAVQLGVEYCYEQGWSDGLPLVPVTAEVVERFFSRTRVERDAVVARADNIGKSCTAELAAVNAAMAGCLPEYFPVVLAALDALGHDKLGTGTAWQSTSSPAPFLVVNGEVRRKLGLNSDGGAFSPGFRANATIGRAIGLIVRNALGIRPQILDQSTQGVPGRWSLCVGESEEESPFEPLSVERGLARGKSAVSFAFARTSEFVDNRVAQTAEELLFDFADTISRTGAHLAARGACALVLGLEHANLLAGGGFTKRSIKEWLVEHCVRPPRDLERVGKGGFLDRAEFDQYGNVRLLATQQNIEVVVVGAGNAAMSLVIRLMRGSANVSCPVIEL